MNKVAIYCRLSEEDKNKSFELQESESIQNQKSLLLSYALKNKWDVYKIYCDEDYSGIDINRPDFNLLLEDAQNQKFNIVLCKTQSRFTRDMEMVEKYIHNKFLEWDIRFVTAVDNVDTGVKGNKKARQINGLINEWYLEDLSENVRAVFNNKRKNGQFIGSYAPYGYKKSEEDHNKLIIDEEAAQTVKKIFEMRLNGFGAVHISKWLNANNILNPTDYRLYMGYPVKTIPPSPTQHMWKDYTVRQILQRETYIGNMVQGISRKISYKSEKTKRVSKSDWIIAPATHEPLIEAETFYKAQGLMSSYIHPASKGQAHILAGKVKCMRCGSTMQRLKAKDHFYLRCKASINYCGICDNSSARFDVVENELLLQIQKMVDEITDKSVLNDMIVASSSLGDKLESLCQSRSRLNAETEKISAVIFKLYSDRVSGIVSEQQFVEMNGHFQKEKEVLVEKADKINMQINMYANLLSEEKDKKNIAEKYLGLEMLTSECVDELIDYVEIDVMGKKRTHKKEINLNIYWNI